MEGQSPPPPQPPQPPPPQPPPPPQMPPQMPPGGYMQQPPKQGASGLAIAALILTIAGIVFCCSLVPSAIGLVLAIMEKGKIARGESSEAGAGFVKAAYILGIIGVAIGVIYWVAWVVLTIIGSSASFMWGT